MLAVIGDANSDFQIAVDNFGVNQVPSDKIEKTDVPDLISKTTDIKSELVTEPSPNNENSRVLASPLAKKLQKKKYRYKFS